MTDPPNLEDLDLTTLNEQEREALEQSFNKTSIAWPAALYCAGLKVFAILIVINAGVGDANAIAFIAIKAAGYVGFGWWARRDPDGGHQNGAGPAVFAIRNQLFGLAWFRCWPLPGPLAA